MSPWPGPWLFPSLLFLCVSSMWSGLCLLVCWVVSQTGPRLTLPRAPAGVGVKALGTRVGTVPTGKRIFSRRSSASRARVGAWFRETIWELPGPCAHTSWGQSPGGWQHCWPGRAWALWHTAGCVDAQGPLGKQKTAGPKRAAPIGCLRTWHPSPHLF